MRKFAALNMVRVIGQIYLCSVIDAAFEPHFLLFSEGYEKGKHTFFCSFAFRQLRICRNIPSLTCQECSFYLSVCTIISCGSLRNAKLIGEFYHRNILHLHAIGKFVYRNLLQIYENLPISARKSSRKCLCNRGNRQRRQHVVWIG